MLQKTYICTSSAVSSGYCTLDQQGRFILDLPSGKSVNTTSFWSARVELPAKKTTLRSPSPAGLWNNPAGNPTPPSSSNTSPWRRRSDVHTMEPVTEVDSSGVLEYSQAIHYPVTKAGFYCVGKTISEKLESIWAYLWSSAAIPVSVQQNLVTRADTGVPYHPSYTGKVLFKNTFDGQLPATDYPKVTVSIWAINPYD